MSTIFRKWIGKLHLWLGLLSGLVVFIISITGCIYAFQQEIQDYTQSYRFVTKRNEFFLSPSQIQDIAERELSGKHAHSVTYEKNGRAAKVVFYNSDPDYYYQVYIDPYNGEVLKVKDMDKDFFRWILNGHFYLWLPPDIGQPAVATSTLLFVILIISGIILWWPKNKNGRRQRFRIKWHASWRRKNYDLHNVLGFYISIMVLILALTGLVWGFQWFAKTVFWVASGGKEMNNYYQVHSDSSKVFKNEYDAVDLVWYNITKEYRFSKSIEVHYPENAYASIDVNINSEEGTYWKRDFRYFDQYTLEEISVNHIYGRISGSSGAEKLIRMNYDIHTGAILGLSGKIVAFCVSLITASLPVTGLLVYIGRKKKRLYQQ